MSVHLPPPENSGNLGKGSLGDQNVGSVGSAGVNSLSQESQSPKSPTTIKTKQEAIPVIASSPGAPEETVNTNSFVFNEAKRNIRNGEFTPAWLARLSIMERSELIDEVKVQVMMREDVTPLAKLMDGVIMYLKKNMNEKDTEGFLESVAFLGLMLEKFKKPLSTLLDRIDQIDKQQKTDSEELKNFIRNELVYIK